MFPLSHVYHWRPHILVTLYPVYYEPECGPMPNVMAAQPNIGGALCESSVIPFLVPCRNVWLTPTTRVPCSNAANNRRTQDLGVTCILHLGKFRNGAGAPENVYIV